MTRFTFAYWCVFLAALLPIFCAGLAKWGTFGKPRREGGFDNHLPRQWLANQTGWRARANAAQANSFEALPFFIGAVVIAHQLGAPQMSLDVLSFVYIVMRLLFIMMYVTDVALVRTIAWTLAFSINVVILFIGYR